MKMEIRTCLTNKNDNDCHDSSSNSTNSYCSSTIETNTSKRRKMLHNNNSSMVSSTSENNTITNTNAMSSEQMPPSLTECSRCGHSVPTSNMVVHEANCGKVRAEQEVGVANGSDSEDAENYVGVASFAGNILPPSTITNDNGVEPAATASVSSTASSSATPLLQHGEWSCQRCTLINLPHQYHCDACLLPRPTLGSLPDLFQQNYPFPDTSRTNTFRSSFAEDSSPIHALSSALRPPDDVTRDQLLPPFPSNELFLLGGNSVNYSNSVPVAPTTSTLPATDNPTTTNTARNNNVVIQQRVNSGYRVFNGLVNGAMIGSIVGGLPGFIVGGIAGGIGGAVVNHVRNRNDEMVQREIEQLMSQTSSNAERNAATNTNDTSLSNRNIVHVHRGPNHIFAIARDNGGQNRMLRFQYGTNTANTQTLTSRGVGQDSNAEVERALVEMFLRMSYAHNHLPQGMGVGSGVWRFHSPFSPNILIQSDMTYEELLARYGMGNENRRGATEEVINSYPVATVVDAVAMDDSNEHLKKIKEKKKNVQQSFLHEERRDTMDITDNDYTQKKKTVDYGTCGICLEDYQVGDITKKLCCPHAFHRDCIDKWLKMEASCPVCKMEVTMFHSSS